MLDHLDYHFSAPLWLYSGKGAWHFVTLPTDMAAEIKFFSGTHKGWGSIPVTVTLENSTWQTSLFPDSKANSYLLPIKAAIRKKHHLKADNTITLSLHIAF